MATTVKMATASDLVKALGLDPSLVSRVVIEIDANKAEPLTIQVTTIVPSGQIKAITDMLTEYELVKRDAS